MRLALNEAARFTVRSGDRAKASWCDGYVSTGSDDDKVVRFPASTSIGDKIDEEKSRRIMAEAKRLANLTPGEWLLWIDDSAEQLGIARDVLEPLVKACLADREKKERGAKAEARRQEQRAERKRKEAKREREKSLKAVAKLPSEHQEYKLAELAERTGESVEAIHDEFAAVVDAGESTDRDLWTVEPWPEPVELQAVLQNIAARIRQHVVLRAEGVTAATLWTAAAWIHDIAIHSPILAAVSVEPESGKTTLLGVLRHMVPKPLVNVEPTGPSVYRTVDRDHPTLIIDETDDLFTRKNDLRHIINAGWTRGTRIPRDGHLFDPFCPKSIGLTGMSKLPRDTASRSIVLKLWPKSPPRKSRTSRIAMTTSSSRSGAS